MRLMGMEAIYRKPRTSAANPEHRVYPYLLRDLAIPTSWWHRSAKERRPKQRSASSPRAQLSASVVGGAKQ